MITYIDTKNREKYQVLFAKAEETLKSADPSKLSAGINPEEVEIATLNQYFAYLQDLITVSSNENIKSYFLRLPLDEELFEINANTRAISIPRSFSSNGVGVQGDETAEIIYFSIDRYFDHTDLANEDMNIVIQWETRDKDRQVITGISPNFGKDIETIPGKIIFGWPIYSELTESPTPIRFAVRFFQLGAADGEGIRPLTYSLATLPAEISVGATIDYDLINKTVQEIDKGKMITGRIKNVGIYDPSIPTPKVPTISTPLYIDGKEADVRIADLPEEGGITLKVSAHPTDIGAVQYNWRKFAYDSATGEYADGSDALEAGVDNGVYEEVTADLGDDLYYRITSAQNDSVIVYSPISKEDYLNNTTYNAEQEGFETKDGNFIKLFKRYSTATVNSVGIYTVRVGARNGVNTIEQKFENTNEEKATGITIPGPLKPVIEVPENLGEDNIIHLIAQDGAITLSTSAHKGEEDENAVVKLTYDWKKVINGVEESVDGNSVQNSALQIYALGQNGHGNAPEDINEDDCVYNQAQITVKQVGNKVIIYHTGEELRTYESTGGQGSGKWLGFDIDTGKSSIVGLKWGYRTSPEDKEDDRYTLSEADVNEAYDNGVGLGAGHIIFWAKAEDLAVTGGKSIKINDDELVITFVEEGPSSETYTFNEDKNEVLIEGLAASKLNEYYIAEVTAERNKVKTASQSKVYRITNAPDKPRLICPVRGQRIEADYTSDIVDDYPMRHNGVYRSLSFSVMENYLQNSDTLSYYWVKMNTNGPNDLDEEGFLKVQIDIGDALDNLFPDIEGENDIILPTELGEIITTNEDNTLGSTLQFSNLEAGYYYCIVVNELNNHRVANVTPFYYIH